MRYNYDTKDFQVAHKLNNEILTFDDYKDHFHIVYEFMLLKIKSTNWNLMIYY